MALRQGLADPVGIAGVRPRPRDFAYGATGGGLVGWPTGASVRHKREAVA